MRSSWPIEADLMLIDACPTCRGERYVMVPMRWVQRIRAANVGDVIINEEYEERIGGMDACPRCTAHAEMEYAGSKGV